MRVTPFDAPLGAEVSEVDLSRSLEEAQFRAIVEAWHRHLVLLFRDQHLTDPQLVAFSRRLGDLDVVPSRKSGGPKMHVEGLPEVAVVSNVVENGVPIGALGAGEAEWHTDMSYVQDPPSASILYAIEIPPEGGDTHFASMYAAYEALPESLRARIEPLQAAHDASRNSTGQLRAGFEPVTDLRKVVGARHPIVRKHPVTGRSAIYLGRRLNGYVETLGVAESETLLDRLWEHCSQGRFAWRHRWRKGDLLMWDNRCTIHRRDSFDSSARRIMHRTQVRASTSI